MDEFKRICDESETYGPMCLALVKATCASKRPEALLELREMARYLQGKILAGGGSLYFPDIDTLDKVELCQHLQVEARYIAAAEIPSHMFDEVNLALIEVPVRGPGGGKAYDLGNLEAMWKAGIRHGVTGLPLPGPRVFLDFALRTEIENFAAEHGMAPPRDLPLNEDGSVQTVFELGAQGDLIYYTGESEFVPRNERTVPYGPLVIQAAADGDVDYMRDLVSAVFDILDVPETDLETAITVALDNGNTEIVVVMLSSPDVLSLNLVAHTLGAMDARGIDHTVLEPIFGLAARYGELDIIRELLKRAFTPRVLENALRSAAKHDKLDIVRELLKREFTNVALKRALFAAAKYGKVDIVRYMLEHRDFTKEDIVQGLNIAADNGNLEVISELSRRDPDLKRAALEQALYVAVGWGWSDVLSTLLQGEEFEQTVLENALDTAARYGNTYCVELLVTNYDFSVAALDNAENEAQLKNRVDTASFISEQIDLKTAKRPRRK